MSDPEAATAKWTHTVSALVCSVAAATGLALPVALVSLVMLLNVNTPLDTVPQGSDSVSVATAVPGLDTVPDRRKTSLPAPAPPSMASRTAVDRDVRRVVE